MGRTVFIVILVVATVCALKSAFQRAAVSTQKEMRADAARASAPPATNSEIQGGISSEAIQINDSAVELARPASELALPGNEPGRTATQAEKNLPLEAEDTIDFAAVSSGVSNSGNRLQGMQTDADAENSPVEATILKEEENGQVVFQATAPTDYMLQLNDIVQNHQYTATYDLLALFRAEFDSGNKEAILSMASLLRRDQNTRLLLEMALATPQPAEIRAQAAAFAAARPDQHLNLLLGHLTDSDPLVQMTIANAFLDTKPTTTIVGARAEPDPTVAAPSRPN